MKDFQYIYCDSNKRIPKKETIETLAVHPVEDKDGALLKVPDTEYYECCGCREVYVDNEQSIRNKLRVVHARELYTYRQLVKRIDDLSESCYITLSKQEYRNKILELIDEHSFRVYNFRRFRIDE